MEAQNYCSSEDAELLSLQTIEEYQFITDLLNGQMKDERNRIYWLGTYRANSKQLVWDGQEGGYISRQVANWDTKLKKWSCVTLERTNTTAWEWVWCTRSCDLQISCICEKDVEF